MSLICDVFLFHEITINIIPFEIGNYAINYSGAQSENKKLHPPKSVRMQFLIDQIILMGLLITTIKQVIYPGNKFVKVEWLCEIVICAKGSCFAVANIHGGDD